MSRFQKFFLGFSLVGKLVLSAILPMSLDESYYWVWSKNLQLSYFDHPAMIAWLFKLGQPLELLGNAVRWPAVFLGHLTLIVWILILKRWATEETINRFLVLALLAPLVGFGSMILTPDLPVIFFWSLAMYFFIETLESPSLFGAAGLGSALGFGFCSKYHIVLFVPAALLYLTFEKQWKKISWSTFLTVIIFGLIFSAPVIIWNYQNDFSSFAFQLGHGFSRPNWLPYWSYSYLAGQILLIFPIPLWLALKSKLKGGARILIYFSVFPLLFFFLSSFRALVEMNWPGVAYPSLYAIAALSTLSWRPIISTGTVWVLAYALLGLIYLFPGYVEQPGKLKELTQYSKISEVRGQYAPLYAETYQMASALWYSTKNPFYKLNGMSRYDFYDTLPGGYPTSKVFYLAMDKDGSFPDWLRLGPYKSKVVEKLDDTFIILRLEHE